MTLLKLLTYPVWVCSSRGSLRGPAGGLLDPFQCRHLDHASKGGVGIWGRWVTAVGSPKKGGLFHSRPAKELGTDLPNEGSKCLPVPCRGVGFQAELGLLHVGRDVRCQDFTRAAVAVSSGPR